MKNTDTLLSLYREYETIIRDRDMDPKDYEETLNDKEKNRLRMIRSFRNYLSHQNDPGFLDVSDMQIKFMKEHISMLKSQDDIVKKHLKNATAGAVLSTDKCADALQKCIKLKTDKIVVITKDGFGVASIYDIILKYVEGKGTKMAMVKTNKSYHVVSADKKMSQIPEGTIICTDTGTKDGKVLGVIYR